jgi:uncharacterized membrane protein YozB (DUF420 family)
MYGVILALHNIIRWVVVIFGLFASGRALMGWIGKKEWTSVERKFGVFFTSAVDTQLLLGFLLYFVLSDITKSAFRDFGSAMSNPGIRFFAFEHVLAMVLGVVLAHLGSALPKKVDDSRKKFMRAAICFSLSFLIILAGIPWSRPLFPGL